MTAFPETFSEPDEVARALAELGLTTEPFQNALQRARLEWATCTEFDPPSYPGTVFWGTTVRALRENLTAIGWRQDDPRNFSIVISPDASMAIVVETGDDDTGSDNKFAAPSTRAPKGISLQGAVYENAVQLEIFREPPPPNPTPSAPLLTYIFLVRVEKNGKITGELSLPSGITSDGKVASWAKRIVIPMENGDGDMPIGGRRRGPELPPEPEVIISRRAG